jgi:hypothetical protein
MSYLTDSIRRGTFANRPSNAPDGTVYVCTDGPLQFVRKNGTWNPYLGSTPLKTPPAANTWSLINATSGSDFSDYRGGLLFNGSYAAGVMHVAKVTAPATPYSITAHYIPLWTGVDNAATFNFATTGICWRQTSNGNLHVFGPTYATTVSGIYTHCYRLLSASGAGSTDITYTNSTDSLNFSAILHNLSSHGIWIRGTDDGTNRSIWYSSDGNNFQRIHSVTRTTSITPNEVGIYTGNFATSGQTVNSSAFFTSIEIA